MLVHTEMPARRGQDWFDLELTADKTNSIVKDKEMDANYYNGKAFVFKRYKTARKHGVQVVNPTKRIVRTINQLLTLREDQGIESDYLFLNSRDEKYSNPTWVRYMKRLFDTSTNGLRKWYVAQHVDNDAVKEAIKISQEMGHSLETQQRDYAERE